MLAKATAFDLAIGAGYRSGFCLAHHDSIIQQALAVCQRVLVSFMAAGNRKLACCSAPSKLLVLKYSVDFWWGSRKNKHETRRRINGVHKRLPSCWFQLGP